MPVGVARQLAQQAGVHLGGVHADLHDGAAGESVGLRVAVHQSLTERPPVLWHDQPPTCGLPELLGAAGGVEVAAEGQHPTTGREGAGAGLEGVEQGRGRELGRRPVARDGRQPGLGQARHRCLGHDEHRAPHGSTLAKSCAARSEPRTDPDTFERVPAARGW